MAPSKDGWILLEGSMCSVGSVRNRLLPKIPADEFYTGGWENESLISYYHIGSSCFNWREANDSAYLKF